jgi:hypothetical protein
VAVGGGVAVGGSVAVGGGVAVGAPHMVSSTPPSILIVTSSADDCRGAIMIYLL